MKEESWALGRYNIPIRTLIITDRLFEQANKLAQFLKTTNSIYVLGLAESKEEAIEMAIKEDFDYLIIAGYLKNETNYRVIEDLRKRHKRFITVQWAMVDSLINIFCSRYKIPLKFERTLPMELFVDFLRAHRNDPLLQQGGFFRHALRRRHIISIKHAALIGGMFYGID